MDKFIILPDVTCDLSEEIRNDISLRDYIPGHVNVDGKDYVTRLDWSLFNQNDFYKLLGGKSKITTAPPSPDEYDRIFEKYVSDGYKIISISLSSKISSTYDVSTLSAKRVKEKYPDAEIACVDSLRMSAAFGIIVLYAQLLQNEGKSFDEVVKWIEDNRLCVHQMGPIDDLIAVAKRGRISMGKAIMGNFAGVKPMGDCNRDGYVTVITKAKGIKPSLEITAEYVRQTAKEPENSIMIIAHTDRKAYAEALKKIVEEKVSPKKIYITDVFSGCGPNIGPGMVGIYYLGDEVSENLEKEKQIIGEINK